MTVIDVILQYLLLTLELISLIVHLFSFYGFEQINASWQVLQPILKNHVRKAEQKPNEPIFNVDQIIAFHIWNMSLAT